MPDQKDQREVIEATRPLDQYLGGKRPGWDVANCVMQLFEECERRGIDSSLLDVTTIRVRIEGSRVIATARHGADPAECPSCHAHAGHAHTDYCQLPLNAKVVLEHQRDTTPPPVPIHRCTDPTCPVHGPHAHAGIDVLMRHPDCTCQFLNAYRTWYAPSFHTRPGCPLAHPDHAAHAYP